MGQCGIGYTGAESINMVKLFCDRCGKEIYNCRSCLQVEIQEVVYQGKNSFEITPDSLSASKVLCADCDNALKEFFNCSIKSY